MQKESSSTHLKHFFSNVFSVDLSAAGSFLVGLESLNFERSLQMMLRVARRRELKTSAAKLFFFFRFLLPFLLCPHSSYFSAAKDTPLS